jgi:hypothetical protein
MFGAFFLPSRAYPVLQVIGALPAIDPALAESKAINKIRQIRHKRGMNATFDRIDRHGYCDRPISVRFLALN